VRRWESGEELRELTGDSTLLVTLMSGELLDCCYKYTINKY